MKNNISITFKNKILPILIKYKLILLTSVAVLIIGISLGNKSTSKSSSENKVHSDSEVINGKDNHDEHGEISSEDDGHGHKEGEDAHENEGIIKLKDSTTKQFGIELAKAQSGNIGTHTTLPAEIALNGDKKAHISPQIPGVVRSVVKTLGDKVQAGQVLAVIHSRELADYKANYLTAREKIELAEKMYEREKTLWEQKITAEQEYLNAKSDVADARMDLRLSEQKLHALGFTEEYLKQLPGQSEESFIVYEIVAPIAGTIIEKHITIGEVLKEDSEPFVIADLNDVWVNINIHQKDLPSIKQGQRAIIRTEHTHGQGTVSYVSCVVDENTRTALARIILPNESGQWRPGTFATANIFLENMECGVVVPKDAIISLEGKSLIFVSVDGGYKAVEVQLGRINTEYIEITSGLEQGQMYVAQGAFTLKTEMTKSTGDPCGGH